MHRFSPNPNLAHLIPWFEWENEAFAKARADKTSRSCFSWRRFGAAIASAWTSKRSRTGKTWLC